MKKLVIVIRRGVLSRQWIWCLELNAEGVKKHGPSELKSIGPVRTMSAKQAMELGSKIYDVIWTKRDRGRNEVQN